MGCIGVNKLGGQGTNELVIDLDNEKRSNQSILRYLSYQNHKLETNQVSILKMILDQQVLFFRGDSLKVSAENRR